MRLFLLQHIDSLLPLLAGAFMCYVAYWPRRLKKVLTSSQQKAVKLFRCGGPLFLFFGLLQFFVFEPFVASIWHRYATADGVASAEFPAVPETTQRTVAESDRGLSYTFWFHDVPGKDIHLRLSFSPVPPEASGFPDVERFAACKAYWEQRGFEVRRESPLTLGAVSGRAFDLQRDGGKARMWVRMVCLPGGIYRVVAVSAGSYHDDPVISRFLDSFRV